MKPIYCSLVFLITALMTQNASAVVLNVNGSGILTGAQNVDVAGVLYDVEFQDNGSFSDIFSVPPAYDVLDSNSALIFSMALMQQVFLDDPQGAFDSDPSLIRGCESTTTNACIAVTPFKFSEFGLQATIGLFFASQAINYNSVLDSAGNPPLVDGFRNTAMSATTSFTSFSGGVLADWTPSAVPIPATMWLFGSGLLGLIGMARRKKA